MYHPTHTSTLLCSQSAFGFTWETNWAHGWKSGVCLTVLKGLSLLYMLCWLPAAAILNAAGAGASSVVAWGIRNSRCPVPTHCLDRCLCTSVSDMEIINKAMLWVGPGCITRQTGKQVSVWAGWWKSWEKELLESRMEWLDLKWQVQLVYDGK